MKFVPGGAPTPLLASQDGEPPALVLHQANVEERPAPSIVGIAFRGGGNSKSISITGEGTANDDVRVETVFMHWFPHPSS